MTTRTRALLGPAVLCVIEPLHRSLVVADDAAVGRFTHAGRTLDLGLTPQWLTDGDPDDVEWRIEWVKLYEGLDLAWAHGITGDHRYAAAWMSLVDSFIEQVPVGHDTTDVTARRVQNWIYAAQRFGESTTTPLPVELVDRLTARIESDLDHIAANLTPERNHRTLELYALLVGALALDDRTRAQDALDLLGDNAATDVWSDGVHRECSSDYHLIVVRSFVGALANAARFGLTVPDQLLTSTMAALRFGLHLQAPDGTTPALSDADRVDFRGLFALAADVLDRAELRWVATRGAAGRPPAELDAVFPTGGYVVQRSSWGTTPAEYAAACHAVFDCGPIGDGGHGHYDHLAVELAGAGHRLVVDPGRYTYAEDASGLRHWFKGSAAHNTVTVDGLDHVPYRRGRPKGLQSRATLVGTGHADGLALAVGAVTSPQYSAIHTRALLFVDRARWIVHDRLRDSTERTYVLRWHLDAAAWQRTTLVTRADHSLVLAPGCALIVRGAQHVTIDSGWVSERYGEKQPAPVVVATTVATAADLLTIVIPTGGGDPTTLAQTAAAHWDVTDHGGAITDPWRPATVIAWDLDRPAAHRTSSDR